MKLAVIKCYIELVEFPHQLSLKSYNELVFLLQLLLQDLVLFSPRILHTKHTQTRFEKKKVSLRYSSHRPQFESAASCVGVKLPRLRGGGVLSVPWFYSPP